MGADMYLYDEKGNQVAYLRASYGGCNLAWVAGESYWQTSGLADALTCDKCRLAFWKAFFERCVAVTPEAVAEYHAKETARCKAKGYKFEVSLPYLKGYVAEEIVRYKGFIGKFGQAAKIEAST